MKTKKLLFGLVEVHGVLYNVLYTVFCVYVLVMLLVGLAYTSTEVFGLRETDGIRYYSSMVMDVLIIYFVGYKLLSKVNYC